MSSTGTTRQRTSAGKRDWVALGVDAARRDDAIAAKVAFLEAMKAEPRNAALRWNLALAEERLGEIAAAAAHLTVALRLNPRLHEAARRLGSLLSFYAINDPERLDPYGLKAALDCDGVARQAITEASLAHVFATQRSLADAVIRSGTSDAARELLLARTDDGLKDDLLIAALRAGTVKDAGQERLLTAIRRLILLDLDPTRYSDRALTALVLALIAQGWSNDHAWAESPDETRALDRIALDRAALAAGDLPAAQSLMRLALYRPLSELLGAHAEPAVAKSIRPRPLRELIEARLSADVDQLDTAAALPRLRALQDAVSQRVAGQYERSPYPRWQSLHLPAPGSLRTALQRYIAPERLAFMDRPFDVLIAGAGTGQHALQSASGYGENGRVLAIDLSAASLAYAERRRRDLGVANVELMVADILDLGTLDRSFDVIECIGVLHHMADPWSGWSALLSRLKPNGLMYVGLYSATARQSLAALRDEPAYPGSGCSDAAARGYRAELLGRPDDDPGGDMKRSRNFWNLSEFRDLVLHECEHRMTLAEIERYLAENALTFRGFTLGRDILEAFARRHPDSPWPGRLADWQSFEAEHPRTFETMYRFWCERAQMG